MTLTDGCQCHTDQREGNLRFIIIPTFLPFLDTRNKIHLIKFQPYFVNEVMDWYFREVLSGFGSKSRQLFYEAVPRPLIQFTFSVMKV